MIDFRKYLFHRLSESTFPRLYNPDDNGGEQQVAPVQQAEPDYDALSQVIHAVPVDKAFELLQAFNIAGRGGLNKRNFEPFRRKLISMVSQTSPVVVRSVMTANTEFFKWLVNYWKSQMPKVSRSKNVNIGQSGQGVSSQGDEQGVSASGSQDAQSFGLGDRIEYFPPAGSDLTHRLGWLMQWEQISGESLFDFIRNWLLSINFMPSGIRFKDDTEDLIKNYLTNADGYQDFGPTDMKKIKSGIGYLNQALLKSFANNEIRPELMSRLIDNLIARKVVRIRGDELEYLADMWLNGQSDSSNKYKMTERMAQRMISRFNNQKMFEGRLYKR